MWQRRGGGGGKTGLYAIPLEDKDAKNKSVFEVKNGQVFINDNLYPTRLEDGTYIIRKLTIKECARLQTVPDDYQFPVSNAQAYKMLGNGFTVDVIAHILSHIPNMTTVDVLSMYDGMGCAYLALQKLGIKVNKYYASEIDKYAIKTTQTNFPDIIHIGDAFQVRDEHWTIKGAK